MNKFFKNNKIIPIFIGMILFLLNSSFCFSQGFNHTWLLGYDIGLFDTNVTSTKARLNFTANSVTVVPETRPMPFRATQGNISDANGNLLIASNGCWIANRTGNMMMNGCCLNPGLFTSDWCDSTTGLPLPHGNVILPFPGDSTKFVLFHQTGNYNANLRSTALYYTIIDMTLDGGLGGVIQKNDTVLQDTLSWGISACKHANGRDWWIVALKDTSTLIYKILLTPNGIASVSTQNLSFPFSHLTNAGQPTFSPDGNKFAYTSGIAGSSPFHDVRICSFDRCSGMFNDTAYIPFNDSSVGLGLAFSSNSKYLYHCSFAKIYQINTDTNNIAGAIDTVATWDGYYSPYPPFGTYFIFMYLAANGKIYVTSPNSVIDLNYINAPDLPDTTCDVQQHALHLPCFSGRGDVNHPNYYLGSAIGSVCDSLGLNVQEINHDFHFSIFPNPSNGNFSISYLLPQNKAGKLEIFDINRRKVYSLRLPQWSTLQMINLPKLSEGLYQCVITSDSSRISKKVAVMKE